MSGPPYPHPNPAPGSNEVGVFQIGTSPIGDITAFDVWSTIISQYANSPTLTSAIVAFAQAMDFTTMFDNFFDLIWNFNTAQGYGLDVWGRIVGAPRTLPISGGPGPATFGFQEPGNDWVGFGQAPFASGSSSTTNVTLTDAQYRPLVLAKIMTNVWDGSIPGFNKILLALFAGRGTPSIIDNGNMSITISLPFVPTALDTAVINSGVLPQPAGVLITVSHP